MWADAFSLGRTNDSLAAAVRAVMDTWQALVVGVIEEGVASGEFTTDEPADVAWQFLGMVDGVNAHAWCTTPAHPTADASYAAPWRTSSVSLTARYEPRAECLRRQPSRSALPCSCRADRCRGVGRGHDRSARSEQFAGEERDGVALANDAAVTDEQARLCRCEELDVQ